MKNSCSHLLKYYCTYDFLLIAWRISAVAVGGHPELAVSVEVYVEDHLRLLFVHPVSHCDCLFLTEGGVSSEIDVAGVSTGSFTYRLGV